MRELAPALASLHREARSVGAQLAIVYIAEAHAADEWPINSTRCAGPGNSVLRPTSLAQRCTLARRMVHALQLQESGRPVYADGIDDAFLEAYAAWPIRLFGIDRQGRLAQIAQPEQGSFRLPALREWLLEEAAKDG